VRFFSLAIALALGGCVDTKTCHNPQTWKPCPGGVAEAGASGSPPSIVSLSLPTCVYLDTPVAMGNLDVTDPDGDAATLKATFSQGVRVDESEFMLDAAHRMGNDWVGAFSILLTGSGGSSVMMEGTDDVSIKVVDAQGGQSAPFCNSISAVR
jgi:hypothetical protein